MFRRYGLPLFLLALVVPAYLSTLVLGVMPEDAGEFQTRFYTLEPAHPTGYPLLIILGKVWVTLWPLGSVADRGNLLSLLFSVGAVLATYSVVALLTNRPIAAFFAGLTLAFTPSLWFYSAKAGPYPFHILLVSLSWLTLLRWQRGKGTLYAAACVLGMGTAHHRMFLMSLPAMGLFILLRDPTLLRRGRELALLALLALLPALSYLLLPLWGIWPLSRFLSHALLINSPMGGLAFRVRGLDAWWRRLCEVVWPNLVQGVWWVGLLISLLGFSLFGLWSRLPRLSRRQRLMVSITFLVLLLTHLVFSLNYVIVPDDRRYYVPVDFVLSVGLGLAAAWMLVQAQRLTGPLLTWFWRGGLVLALLVLPAWEFRRHRSSEDQEHGRFVSALTREGLVAIETNASIVASPGFATSYWYYQQVEGWRPDVTVYMNGATIGQERAIELIENGHPIYFRDPLYGLDRPGSGYAWLGLGMGGLDRAMLRPLSPAWAVEIDHSFHPGLRLIGAAMSEASLSADTFVVLWLRWQTETLPPATAGLSIWLDGVGDHRWWQQDVSWSHAVSSIGSHGIVSTTHHLVVPAGMPPGLSRWNIQVSDGRVPLGEPWQVEVSVERPAQTLPPGRFPLSHPLPTPWVAGPIAVLGYNRTEGALETGGFLSLSLLWQAREAPATDWRMRLWIWDVDNPEVQVETPLSSLVPGWPTRQWLPGDLFLGHTALRIPAAWSGGRYRLTLELHGPGGVAEHTLGSVRVAARPVHRRPPRMAHARDDRLGEAIRLLGYDLEPRTVAPGETLQLTLYWQAVDMPEGNYKVFNHLVGADEFLAGQQDGLPGGSVVLTGEWLPGEVVVDRYEIQIQEETAPGEVVLYTGMYRSDDGWRLPAVDGAGQRWLNDMIALDTISVAMR